MKINKKTAKKISYGGTRNLENIQYIVIHYTGNSGDSAKGNAIYFANSNTRQAGAHYFVDDNEIWESVPPKYTAWSVGGYFTNANGAGKFYQRCTNSNSISIEICNSVKTVSWNTLKNVRKLIIYIQKICPNAKTIIRHFDVNGKSCPGCMASADSLLWKRVHTYLEKGYQIKGQVKTEAILRKSPRMIPGNKIGKIVPGKTVFITKIKGNWGRLKKKTLDGQFRWISLKEINEI